MSRLIGPEDKHQALYTLSSIDRSDWLIFGAGERHAYVVCLFLLGSGAQFARRVSPQPEDSSYWRRLFGAISSTKYRLLVCAEEKDVDDGGDDDGGGGDDDDNDHTTAIQNRKTLQHSVQ